MRHFSVLLVLFAFLLACETKQEIASVVPPTNVPYLTILGIAQDAGYPQAACQKACCQAYWEGKVAKRHVSCIGLSDPINQQKWLFDATPDFKNQLEHLDRLSNTSSVLPDGIFLTHAHIGHYTGLMQLGREAIGSKAMPVYAMPKMRQFLSTDGPWSQLVTLGNIALQTLSADSSIVLNKQLEVIPFLVPHRDEYSETVGYHIQSKNKSAIFIPDIDKWEKWDRDILALIQRVDYAILDASFYRNGEIPNRDMSEIPHPFVEESMQLFAELSESDRQKIIFIHFNHTNPLLQDSEEKRTVEAQGFKVAKEGMILEL